MERAGLQLFAEENHYYIATVQTHVVEDSALASKVYFIAVRSLHDADARSECQQISIYVPESAWC